MTEKNDYLIQLFDEYNEVLEHCNKPCKNMFSKDEFWTRHRIFKELQADMKSYSFKIYIKNLKQNIRNFFAKFKRKRKDEPTAQPSPTVPDEPTIQDEPTVATEPTVPPGSIVQAEPAEPTESNVPTESTAQSEQQVIKKRRGRKRKIIK